MYGLMKAHVCSRHHEEAQQYRMHYCGVCKSMGGLYGQKSRLLLNNDAVFLAELLTVLAPHAQAPSEWNRAYQSYNCFTLPESAAEMPLPLQVAAAATLLMTEFKIADQITDGGNRGWKFAHKLLMPEFGLALEQMKTWGFPLDELQRWGTLQDERERAAREHFSTKPAEETLARVAEPTATVTGLVFQHSGTTVGCDLTIQQRLYALGKAFGALVYVLDAYEDYAKDGRRGEFNALQAAFGLSGATPDEILPERYNALALAHLRGLCENVETELRALPLPPAQAGQFVTRLRSNLIDRLGEEIGWVKETVKIAGSVCVQSVPHPSLSAQWKTALSLARTLTNQHRQQQTSPLTASLTSPGVFCTILTIALFFPQQAKRATSYRECRDIACNLIFLGAALRGLTRMPSRLLPSFGSLSPVLAIAGKTAGGVLQSKEDKSSGSSGSLTHSSSQSTSVTVRKTRRRNPCCGDLECCDGCCCACEGTECCCACEAGECCSACDCCTACS